MPKLMTSRTARRIAIPVLICLISGVDGRSDQPRHEPGSTPICGRACTCGRGCGGSRRGVLTPVGSDHRWFFNPNLEVGFR